MFKSILISLIFMLIGCQNVRPKSDSSKLSIEDVYINLIKDKQDADGFIDTNHCDALLHTGLLSVQSIDVNLNAAELNGQWFRRPLSYPECYTEGKSRSTISRDMLLGVLWYAVANNDLDTLERMWDYGTSHAWIMGNNEHTIMNPNMISLLARSIKYLNGEDYKARHLPMVYPTNCEGYVCHLAALQIALNGHIFGQINSYERDYLINIANKNPNNILYAALKAKYTDGDYRQVHRLLSRYPTTRLPNNTDWCDDWPVQRDDNDIGLKPCTEDKQHSGGEVLFVLWLMTN
jgi:hypothetical protein